jgi:phospholipid/cholesterol/gamma-HCH transport system substrate-binding protein
VRRTVTLLALGAAVVAVIVVLAVGSGSSPTLYATFQSATNLVDGNYVTVGGVRVGSVGRISVRGGVAQVALSINNRRAWPLHRGTHAEIRFGGTASYSDRYVELLPGPATAPLLHSGARLPLADTVTPVEFDQLFDTFTPGARQSLGGLVDNSAGTFATRGKALAAGLATTPPALDTTSQVLADLNVDPGALQTLISAGATVARALHDTQPQLLSLVSGAGSTFGEITRNTDATEATLARLPGTLGAVRHSLTSLNPTLGRLHTLVTALSPGAVALRGLATPVSDVVRRLTTVAPQLNETLATVERSAPRVTTLLSDARPLARNLTPALSQLGPIIGCLRVYSPELAGFIATWHSLGVYHDGQGVYGRVTAQQFPFPDTSPLNSDQLVKTIPDLLYSLIRPPGFAAGQTWYQPQCDAGPSGLNAGDDPEAQTP